MTIACGLVLAVLGAADYSSQFRASASVLVRKAEADSLWRQIDAAQGAFNEISVFTQGTGAVMPLGFHRAQAARIPPFFTEARRRGLSVGINVLCTVGFNEEAYDPKMDKLPMRVNPHGDKARGTLCSGSPETLAYAREQFRIYAETKPDFIYVDDDVASVSDCRCGQCIRRFAHESGLLTEATADLAALNAIFGSSDIVLRRRAREAWLRFTEDRRAELYAAAASGVHAVDPSIGMGAMTCMSGSTGLDNARWAKALAGDSACEVRWRPGGGCWRDNSLDAMLDKAERNAIQTFGLPDTVKRLQAEIENYPYQILAKSPDFMGFEAVTDVGWGCSGVAWSFATLLSSDYVHYAPYFARAAGCASACRLVLAAQGLAPSKGIAYPWDGHSAADVASANWNPYGTIPLPLDLAHVGFPVASDPMQAVVTLLDASCAMRLDDGCLRRLLTRGVFMDAGALQVVCDRGFEAFVGVRLDGVSPREAIVRDTDHALNPSGRSFRDIRVFLGREPGVRLLKAMAKEVSVTAEAVGFCGERHGVAGTVFENPSGGRVAVETMLPFSWCETPERLEHLRRLFRWLSRERLPAYVASTRRLALRVRGEGLLITNVSSSKACDVEVAWRGGTLCVCTRMAGGLVTGESTLEPVRRDGDYAVYHLAEVPHLGHALLVPLKTIANQSHPLPARNE